MTLPREAVAVLHLTLFLLIHLHLTQGSVPTCDPLSCFNTTGCEMEDAGNGAINLCECQGNRRVCPMAAPGTPHGPDVSTCRRVTTDEQTTGCEAYINWTCSTVGPQRGSSNLIIWGGNFPSTSISIKVGPFDLVIKFRNSTLIHCMTPSMMGIDVVGSMLPLTVYFGTECTQVVRSAFTFRVNPVIQSITPDKIIPSGGIELTISGEGMDAVSQPILMLNLIINTDVTRYVYMRCQLKDASSIICPSPSLLPWQQWVIAWSDVIVNIGIIFDGVTEMIDQSAVHIEPNPIVDMFVTPDHILGFHPNWPDYDETFEIKGANLKWDSLMRVTVGHVFCDEVLTAPARIICHLPSSPPGDQDGVDLAVEVAIGNFTASPGYVRYDLSPWGNLDFRYGIVGGLVAIALAISIACIVVVARSEKKRKAKETDTLARKYKATTVVSKPANPHLVGDYLAPDSDLLSALRPALKKLISDTSIAPSSVQEEIVLYRGTIGEIYSGWILSEQGEKRQHVLIKTFKESSSVPFYEIERLVNGTRGLAPWQHENLLPVKWFSISDDIPRAIYPYVQNGNLKHYLIGLQNTNKDKDVRHLLGLARDIARGMAYLTNAKVIHGDLAARNCWLGEGMVAKVSDRALAHDMFPKEYYQPGERVKPKPVRWMAPELLQKSQYSIKSDVWAFGVTLWEIVCLGTMPYSIFGDAAVKSHVLSGNHLIKPNNVPVQIFTLMTQCWVKVPKQRTTFSVIDRKLTMFISRKFKDHTLPDADAPPHYRSGESTATDTDVPTEEEEETRGGTAQDSNPYSYASGGSAAHMGANITRDQQTSGGIGKPVDPTYANTRIESKAQRMSNAMSISSNGTDERPRSASTGSSVYEPSLQGGDTSRRASADVGSYLQPGSSSDTPNVHPPSPPPIENIPTDPAPFGRIGIPATTGPSPVQGLSNRFSGMHGQYLQPQALPSGQAGTGASSTPDSLSIEELDMFEHGPES